jgi:surface carbohydrate biosynthesis protein
MSLIKNGWCILKKIAFEIKKISSEGRRALRAKWVWKRPKTATVLIYDRVGSEIFSHYISSNHTHVLDVREESLNIYVMLYTLLLRKDRKKKHSIFSNIRDIYKDVYIQFVNPSIVLTFIDNNTGFYELKSENFIKIFVQNGLRPEWTVDFLKTSKHIPKKTTYFVDYMCVFTQAIGERYSCYIEGEVLSIGSFKNNLSIKKNKKNENTLIFISQYEPSSRDSFIAGEAAILPFLIAYTNQHKLKLLICARTNDSRGEESLYFKSFLQNSNSWEILYKKTALSSYDYLDHSKYIVTIDSTLGHEALGRGHRVAMFSIRSERYSFGWPANLSETGPFWTNRIDILEFERVMNYLMSVGDEEWLKISRFHAEKVMEYDPGNTRFLSLMKQLNVPLKAGIS